MSREPCDMLFKPCEPGMQDCVGFGHCRCQKELDRQTSLRQQLATLTQERDALRASLANLVRDGNWLLTHLGDDGMAGETAALDFGMSLEESEQLLTPSGEAGKGGGV